MGNKPANDKNVAESNQVADASDAEKQAKLAAELEAKNVNEEGEQVDGRRPSESEKPRPAVNRPTVPEEAPVESLNDADAGRGELKDSSGMKYYVNREYSAGTVVARNKDGEVVDKVRFVPYYDTWKGDQVRVGYLATDNKNVQETLENDYTAEEISFSEYKKALRGDGKRNQALGRAPVPASV